MATRCQILVEGATTIIYRHSDGYPDGPNGVLRTLIPCVRDFIRFRGLDDSYLPAHICYAEIAAHKKYIKSRIREAKKNGKKGKELDFLRSEEYMGYGVEAYDRKAEHPLHGDIEYLYVVKRDHVEVRECRFEFDKECKCHPDNTKIAQLVGFNGKLYKPKLATD